MAYTPYDWTQNLQHRQDYVQDRLREGSPVVAISYTDGVLLLTLRRTQNKVFEIYDRLIFSGMGHQADLENLRLAAIDFAHKEGFSRSPEDVTAQRVVGVALSPVLKRSFGDFFNNPMVVRCLFAELGQTIEEDVFCQLDFDGEFMVAQKAAVAGGTKRAEADMLQAIEDGVGADAPDLRLALKLALSAWAAGRSRGLQKEDFEGAEATPRSDPSEVLRTELQHGTVEAAILERNVDREERFRHLTQEEISAVLEEVLAAPASK